MFPRIHVKNCIRRIKISYPFFAICLPVEFYLQLRISVKNLLLVRSEAMTIFGILQRLYFVCKHCLT